MFVTAEAKQKKKNMKSQFYATSRFCFPLLSRLHNKCIAGTRPCQMSFHPVRFASSRRNATTSSSWRWPSIAFTAVGGMIMYVGMPFLDIGLECSAAGAPPSNSQINNDAAEEFSNKERRVAVIGTLPPPPKIQFSHLM